MTSGQGERARLQTLLDAITEAMKANGKIAPYEEIAFVTFGEFDDGGWYWEIVLILRRVIGNTKQALAPQAQDFTTVNTRKILETAMAAQTRGLVPDRLPSGLPQR